MRRLSPGCSFLPSCPSSRPAADPARPGALPAPPHGRLPPRRSPPRISGSASLDLRGRLDARPPGRHRRATSGATPTSQRANAARCHAAGDAGGFLQRGTAGELRGGYREVEPRQPARATLPLFRDYYPYQATFDVPARPINGAQVVYIGSAADSASLPSREALQGQGRGVPQLGQRHLARRPRPRARRDDSVSSRGSRSRRWTRSSRTFSDVLPSAASSIVKHASAAPAGVTQPRLLFVQTGAVPKLFGKPLDQLRPGDTGTALQGDVAFAPTELAATNVVAIIEGSDPALRGEYVALGAHNDAIGIVSPVDHDSLRAYNTVVRPRGANDPAPSRHPSSGAASRRSSTACAAPSGPARFDRERRRRRRLRLHGAARDRRGVSQERGEAEALAALRLAHRGGVGTPGQPVVHRPPDRSARLDRGQINIDMIGRGDPVTRPKGGPGYVQAHRLAPALDRARRPGGGGEHRGEARPGVRLHVRRQRPPGQVLLPQRPLQVRPLRDSDRLLQHRQPPRLPPGDRRGAVHRLRASSPGSRGSSRTSARRWRISTTGWWWTSRSRIPRRRVSSKRRRGRRGRRGLRRRRRRRGGVVLSALSVLSVFLFPRRFATFLRPDFTEIVCRSGPVSPSARPCFAHSRSRSTLRVKAQGSARRSARN